MNAVVEGRGNKPAGPLDASVLPTGVRARMVEGVNGLDMHILEAGAADRPCLLLLHGFPELAFSWRGVMAPLAEAGFYVVAPDQRGFGRTTGWDGRYEGDVASFRNLNLVEDLLSLLRALDVGQVEAVVGHDLGAAIAGYCALTRPEVFARVVMMSAPFTGAPSPPYLGPAALDAALAALSPPRKHYTHYYSGAAADAEMGGAPQGLHDFLRAYFHVKSGDWAGNAPYPLAARTAEELAKLPAYYVMAREAGMAETVRPFMPSPAEIAACAWMPEEAMAVFAAEYARTGFQGGLQWYRVRTDPDHAAELAPLAGRQIEVPAWFIAGDRDWGIHQTPGALAAMRDKVCTRMEGVHLIPGAGHWVQQENPHAVVRLLLDFLEPGRV